MSSRSRVVVLSLVAASAACIAISWFVFHFDGFMGPDSGARFAMVRSWAEGGSPFFLSAHEHAGVARATDPLVGYTVALPNGSVSVVYPPLFTLLGAMGYFAIGRAGLVIVPAVAGVLAAAFTYFAARAWMLRSRHFAPLAIFFGTPLVIYASTFWDHSIHIALVAAGTWLLIRAFRGRPRDALVAGAIVGAGVWFHELLLAAGIAFALSLVPHRALFVRWVAGFATPVVTWATLNTIVYGTPGGPHLRGPLDPCAATNVLRLTDVHAIRDRVMLELAGGTGPREALIVIGALAVLALGHARQRRIAIVLTCAVGVLAASSIGRHGFAGGFLQATPWLLFAFVDRPAGDGWRDVAHRTLARATLFFALIVLLTPIAPGLNWGSRYLLTMLPPYVLLALRAFERRFAGARVVVAAYALVAAFVFGRATTTYAAKVHVDRMHARAMMNIHDPITATDRWWLGPELEPTTFSTSLALVAYIAATEQLGQPLPRDPDRAVRDAFFARASSVDEFSFVGGAASLDVLRVEAGVRGWRFMESRTVEDLSIARFTRERTATATPSTP